MRRKIKTRKALLPDLNHDSVKVAKLINYVMERGKKNIARRIVYRSLSAVETKAKQPALGVFEQALKNVAPQMEVRSRRVGGANYQVPHEVRPERQLSLSLRWIIGAAKAKKGSAMDRRLAEEILAAADNTGEAVKKRENIHKMAEANRAFAHFAWTRRKK